MDIEKGYIVILKVVPLDSSFVECLECGRKLHQICVLHLDNIWPSG